MKKLFKTRILPFFKTLLFTPIIVLLLVLLSLFFTTFITVGLVFLAFFVLFVGSDTLKNTLDEINEKLEE